MKNTEGVPYGRGLEVPESSVLSVVLILLAIANIVTNNIFRSFLFIFGCPEDKSALAVKNIAMLYISRSFVSIFECPEDKSALAAKNIATLYIFRSFLFIFQNKWLYSPVYYYIRG